MEDNNISLSNIDAERKKENKVTKHLNTPLQIIKWSPSGTPIEG